LLGLASTLEATALAGLGYLGATEPMTFGYFFLMDRWPFSGLKAKLIHANRLSEESMTGRIKVEVLTGSKSQEYEMPEGSTIEDLLSKMNLHPDAYIITKESKPTPITSILEDGERLKLIKVASGG
jgi:sulfur carrier protein ThiS